MNYPLTHIGGIEDDVASLLKAAGVRSTGRLLDAAYNPKGRKALAETPSRFAASDGLRKRVVDGMKRTFFDSFLFLGAVPGAGSTGGAERFGP